MVFTMETSLVITGNWENHVDLFTNENKLDVGLLSAVRLTNQMTASTGVIQDLLTGTEYHVPDIK